MDNPFPPLAGFKIESAQQNNAKFWGHDTRAHLSFLWTNDSDDGKIGMVGLNLNAPAINVDVQQMA